jgi:hypothetical protein
LIYEEDFVRMDVLAEYNRRWYGGEAGTADALLDAARALITDHAVRDEVWITDTLFPGFFWLLVASHWIVSSDTGRNWLAWCFPPPADRLHRRGCAYSLRPCHRRAR